MGKNKQIIQNSFTEFLLYTTPHGKVKVEIYLRDENLWLTQKKWQHFLVLVYRQ